MPVKGTHVPPGGHRRFECSGIDVVLGRGAVARLGEYLAERSLGRALLVCGPHVGSSPGVVQPLRAGLGSRLAGVYDQTSTLKTVESVFGGIDALRELSADVIVGVGAGSSLDTARQISVFGASGRPLDSYLEQARRGRVEPPVPQSAGVPVIVVPTTLAGADLGNGGSVLMLRAAESPTGVPVRVSGRVAPTAAWYDPALFEATPLPTLLGSAMNGFDKGLESLYSQGASPIRDATAARGLQMLESGLPGLASSRPGAIDRVVEAMILVQYRCTTSVIHAFGHGFSRQFPVHQGLVHAVVAPHVLRFVLDRIEWDRELFAASLNLDRTAGHAAVSTETIVAKVAALRDTMQLPTRLGDVIEASDFDFGKTAAYICAEPIINDGPPDLAITVDEVEDLLRCAW